jgi:hypothetical protein
MPWTVRIEDEDGKPVSREDYAVPFTVLASVSPKSVMLQGIDRYCDTTFNSLQIKFFLKEWDALAETLTEDEHRQAWKKVRDYAEQCMVEPHLYLKFIGD